LVSTLPPHNVSLEIYVKRKKLIVCEHCGRILAGVEGWKINARSSGLKKKEPTKSLIANNI